MLNSGQNLHFLSCVTLKFDWWPWKTIGHLFYTTLSFVHHFKAIGEFKFELQSGNFQVKIGNILCCVTLKFDGWPWKKIGHFFYAALSFVHQVIAINEYKQELQSGNAQFGSNHRQLDCLHNSLFSLTLKETHMVQYGEIIILFNFFLYFIHIYIY